MMWEGNEEGGGAMTGFLRRLAKLGRDGGAEESAGLPGLLDASGASLEKDTSIFLGNVECFARAELNASLSELECLEKMNRVSLVKYEELGSTVDGLTGFQQELFNKYEGMKPMLAEVDALHKAVADLEKAADYLDGYSKRLEAKAKQVLNGS